MIDNVNYDNLTRHGEIFNGATKYVLRPLTFGPVDQDLLALVEWEIIEQNVAVVCRLCFHRCVLLSV
ncbi:hypothetical protein HLRTI_000391 [Halorhabdus tiamatea SARL4B]|uniref:Uncharacterized protein n=1 Tax=Halorhabdus tiamatea SARL4B TaxID=1033806 RepID=U2FBF9_9EURY|nr:hypothetical protein HLRTI_000391 [Halorhabdus tiamatea SARL4B]